MERIRWINHNGHEILMLDYSNLLENKFIVQIEKATEYQIKLLRKELFLIYNMTNTRTTPQVIKTVKMANDRLAKRSVHRRIAWIGFNRMQRIIARIIKPDIYFANNIDDALIWLEKEVEKSHSKNLRNF